MYIRAKISSGAKKEVFRQVNEDHFEVSVKEKAERNLANERIIELFSVHYGLPKGKIRIVNGHHSSTKLLIVDED
jgi:uncharacterized protein YggU (UPF0235/DUF167 family)